MRLPRARAHWFPMRTARAGPILRPHTRRRPRGWPRVNVVAPEKIRNVALVGHQGAGKTTLAEALLFQAGALSRRGRVEDRNTACDFEPEEHEKGFSLSLAIAPFEWQ